MSDQVIRSYAQGAYQTLIDAESVTSTAVTPGSVLRQRVQVSVRDVTTGTPTEIGDAANQAIRVSVIGSVTTTGGGGGTSSNITVSNWLAAQTVTVSVATWTAQAPVTVSVATWTAGTLTAYFTAPVTITGSVTATVSGTSTVTFSGMQPVTFSGMQPVTFSGMQPITFSGTQPVTQSGNTWLVTQSGAPWLVSASQGTNPWAITFSGTQPVSATQGTNPWTVTYSQGTQNVSATQGTNPWTVTFSAPAFFPVAITLSSQWPATTTFLPVTFTNPTVAISGTSTVTFSQGTQLVSATQGTNPWIVTYTAGTQITDPSNRIGRLIGTLPFSNQNDTYTTTGNGVTADVSASPRKSFAIEVKGTGAAATSWDVRLEGSLDNSVFTQVLQHTQVTGDGVVVWSGTTLSPCLYFRSRAAGLVLGGATNIVVTILGMA